MSRASRAVRRRPLPQQLPAWEGVPPILRRLYAQRGVTTERELDLQLSRLHSPWQMLAMEAAREGGKPLVDSQIEVARAVDSIKSLSLIHI